MSTNNDVPEIMKTVMGNLHDNNSKQQQQNKRMTTIAGSVDGESGFVPTTTDVVDCISGLEARLNYPTGLALSDDKKKKLLYVTDQKNQRLVCLTPQQETKKSNSTTYTLSVLMGNTIQFDEETGIPLKSKPKGDNNERSDECDQLNHPAQILLDSKGGKRRIYFTDKDNHRICRIQLLDDDDAVQEFETLAGSIEGEGELVNGNTNPLDIRFKNPMGMAIDTSKGKETTTMYVADIANHAIRVVSFTENGNKSKIERLKCETLFGGTESGCQDGSYEDAKLHYPLSVALSADCRFLYVADFGNNRIVQVDLINKMVSTLAGSSKGEAGSGDGGMAEARFTMPTCVACNYSTDEKDEAVYVTDWSNHRVCRIVKDETTTTAATTTTTTIIGSSVGESGCSDSLLNNPGAVVVDGTTFYLADTGNNRICKVAL